MKRPDITPGPWNLTSLFPAAVIVGEARVTPEGRAANVVAMVHGSVKTSFEANKKAIAAVPVMLNALELAFLLVNDEAAKRHEAEWTNVRRTIRDAMIEAGYSFTEDPQVAPAPKTEEPPASPVPPQPRYGCADMPPGTVMRTDDSGGVSVEGFTCPRSGLRIIRSRARSDALSLNAIVSRAGGHSEVMFNRSIPFTGKWDPKAWEPAEVFLKYAVDQRPRFRWHRGSLEESLKTEVHVGDFQALEKLIKDAHGPGEVQVRFYCRSDRPRDYPDTYVVTHNGDAVGFTDHRLKPTKS